MPKKLTLEQFIERSDLIHNNKYDYSLVDYKNSSTRIKIICPEHGIFKQIPNDHLNGNGCSSCKGIKKLTTKDFIKQSKEIHGDKYDYSLVNYINCRTKVKIICKEHGVFEQSTRLHLNNSGCPKCKGVKKLTTEEFIKQSKTVHDNKYDYSLSIYKGCNIKVKIICKEHGLFEQTPSKHINNQGCPVCNESKGEKEIRKLLDNKDVIFETQKRFNECRNILPLPFDFYLPDYNTCIEYDGEQHFRSVKYFGGEQGLIKRKLKDDIKNEYCKNNNIKLIRIKYNENINILEKQLNILNI